MVDRARLEQTENGVVPSSEGWSVLNARDAACWRSDHFGATSFEGEPEFPEYGMNVQIPMPAGALPE